MNKRLPKRITNLLTVGFLLVQSFLGYSSEAVQALTETFTSPYPCNGVLYDFLDSNQGWIPKEFSQRYGKIEGTQLVDNESPAGKNTLLLSLDLNGGHPSAEFMVDLQKNPPGCAKGLAEDEILWEPGSILSVWVWAPKGSRGEDQGNPNGLHLFAVDTKGKELYGTWQNIQEESWFEVSLNLINEAPACGTMPADFDSSHIKNIGLNISVNTNANNPIKGQFKISAVGLKSGHLPTPVSSHLYSFDNAPQENESPIWNLFKGWNAEAVTDFNFEEKAFVLNANFLINENPPNRKGVLGLIYSPALNLSGLPKGQDTFSLDIRFDPPPDLKQNPCPFVIKLWVYDNSQNITFASDDRNVGSQYITRVAFRLSDFADILTNTVGKADHERIGLSQIGQMGFQIYGNVEYHGKIWIDNIAFGGIIESDALPSRSFVKTSDAHFTVDSQRFRFIGANAEYLPLVSDEILGEVLDRAQSLGIQVIRTWGFGDGCEDYNQPSCEDWSRYFQPLPGVYNKSAFEHFDHIVYEAGKRNIRLIIPLANNWGEYGGIPRYVCWHEKMQADCPGNRMDDDLHDTFYTDEDIKEWYRQYVNHFVNHVNTLTGVRYADDPTIMAWELINEPRAKSDPSGAKLHTWIVEMSGYLAALAPNQLIGIGEEGWYIMPREEADQNTWQEFESNYWQYGVNWMEVVDGCEITWGSNGTDFLSDNSSSPTVITWQDRTTKDSSGKLTSSPSLSDERAAVPDIDFTGIHLYPAPGETNLSRAPYCDYYGLDSLCSSAIEALNISSTHQAKEWLRQHVITAHDELNKPFILEELNFSTLTKLTSGNQPSSNGNASSTVTKEERARLFSQYLDFSYRMDVDGVMFWNLGYDGFAQQAWGELDKLTSWEPTVAGTVSKGDERGIKLEYSTDSGSRQAEMSLSDPQVDWLLADGSHIMLDLYNEGDAREVLVEVQTSDSTTPKSSTFEIKAGSNQAIDLTELFSSPSPKETQTSSSTSCNEPKPESPVVTKIKVVVKNYKSPGNVYFNFYTIFNNKYVIYPNDPLEDVIRLASSKWQKDVSPESPAVKIDNSLTCGAIVHPKLLHESLPIQFDFNGSIEHPEGFYYRYFLDGPKDSNVLDFGTTAANQTTQLLLSPAAIGKYQITIAPEGIGFDEPEADSCYFEVGNDVPLLAIDKVQVDGQEFQPPYENINVNQTFFQINRQVEIQITGKDDVSPDLKVGCRLLRGKKKLDKGYLFCPSDVSAATKLDTNGIPAFISGKLPAGNYQLQLWLEDEESGISKISVLHIRVPLPLYVFGLMGLIVVASLVFWKRNSHTKRTLKSVDSTMKCNFEVC